MRAKNKKIIRIKKGNVLLLKLFINKKINQKHVRAKYEFQERQKCLIKRTASKNKEIPSMLLTLLDEQCPIKGEFKHSQKSPVH